MKKLWLIFAQTTTAGLAVWFLLSLLRPDLLQPPAPAPVVTVQQNHTEVASAPAVASYSPAAKRAMPSVVNIYTAKEVKTPLPPLLNDPRFRRFLGDRLGGEEQRASSLGSGVIVSEQGYIITNNHVVESADEIEVALSDGRTATAKLIGADPDTDLAVIKIELDRLPAITFADASKAEIGDVVLAIGNPFGVGQTVTMGIISALGRSELGINTFENFIQTDAPINPGNSGGALIDTKGNLVGINTAIYSRTGGSLGIGFAIPASTIRQIMDALIKDGSVTRGWLGVEMQEVTPELAASFRLDEAKGALIAGVVRGGPADRAGLKPGDVLLKIGGSEVRNASGMLNLIAAFKPDEEVEMEIFRRGKPVVLPVKLGKRPKFNNRR
ncbi:Do family serine endopeptidase [Iodobacter fluviatilis]|uniref:Periplasmic pH-dependent serine endoprotease DegQ n=1 Tax=Iodobacter fluviatilis TaxID=537 RepID=A0A377SSI1_9NEIS|nr:Do family serine endopeptidase [Iodobacter fluviatilis]TCU85561.1 serine protease DegQ [Iodobacter fluviatilis]STR44991.1 Periplasmic pH-dependent serine endoprotease DegQ precursor [Iodobacter fluviatilis]